ncbi:MAG: hypothetical protein Q9227_006291 [Pyrenula ochraceoflavens]
MPRPPYRGKIAQPNTAVKRVAKGQSESPRAFLSRQVEHKPIGRVPVGSDESDDFVKVGKATRNRRGVPRKDVYASGGLGPGDEPRWKQMRETSKKRASDEAVGMSEATSKRRKVENQVQKSQDRVAIRSSHDNPTRRTRDGNTTSSSSQTTIAKAKDSAARTAIRHLPRSQTSSLGFGAPATPLGETSVLANVKRRPRQPSILSNLNLQDEATLDDMDDLDDLEPYGESTPFEGPKDRKKIGSSPLKATVLDPHVSSSIGLLSKSRRKQSAMSSRNSNSSLRENGQNSGSENENHVLPAYHESRPQQPNVSSARESVDSDTFAPPQSSSPPSSQLANKTLSRQVESKQRTPPIKNGKTINGLKQRRNVSTKHPSTSELQSLMPQPRRGRHLREKKQRDDFEIPEDSSNESDRNDAYVAEDQDSSFAAPQWRKRPMKSAQAPSRKSTQRTSKAKQATTDSRKLSREKNTAETKRKNGPRHGRQNATSTSPLRSTSPPQARRAAKQSSQQPSSVQPKRKQTYSSSRHQRGSSLLESNKENLPLDTLEDSSQTKGFRSAPIPNGTEKIRKQFEEVDGWALSFEDVPEEGVFSSSPDQR